MSEFVDIQDRSCEQYLYGLPLAGVRRLAEGEVQELSRFAQNRRAAYFFWFLIGPGLVLMLTAAMLVIWKAGIKTSHFDLLAGILVIAYVLSPVTLWLASRARVRLKSVRRTIETRSVRVFKGMSRRELVTAMNELHALPGNVGLEAGRDVTVELYYDYDVLLSFGKERIKKWKRLFVTKATGIPEKMEYETRKREDGSEFRVRKMTKKEMREMKRYYRRSFKPWVLLGFAFVYFLGAGLALRYTKIDTWILVGALAVGGFIALVMDLRRLTGPLRDERGGTVLAITKNRLLEENPALEIQNPGLLGEELVEVLPNTGIIWREGREPAAWRDGCR